MNKPHYGKVFIVGAGPGDPELLTLKAASVLSKADVVLYDRLINPELLTLTKPHCEFLYVGKEDGRHLISQDEINEFLVYYALKYSTVVRLKGGDPFVFGRGGEEAIFLNEKGILFEVVPGVTSPLSVPACAGIPLTHRGLASSYAVITGHEVEGDLIKWNSFLGIDTLVFLMAVSNRQKIAEKLIHIGRNPEEPVAFIENGTTANQKVIISNLRFVLENPPLVKAPAVFVVGEVVNLRDKIKFESTSYYSISTFNLHELQIKS